MTGSLNQLPTFAIPLIPVAVSPSSESPALCPPKPPKTKHVAKKTQPVRFYMKFWRLALVGGLSCCTAGNGYILMDFFSLVEEQEGIKEG